jgi:hypothetical protein
MIKDLYRYVWKISGRDQVILSALAVTLFLLELAPLELQQRIVNGAVDRQAFGVIGLLCLLYVVVALVQGGLKLIVNVYRGSVSEAASRRLRLETNLIAVARSEKARGPKDEGVAISIIVSEVDAVGGFVGASFSEPVLSGGILLSVFAYMSPGWLSSRSCCSARRSCSSHSCRGRSTAAPSCVSRPCERSASTSSTRRPIERACARRPTGAGSAMFTS